jgi:hypothetical protein
MKRARKQTPRGAVCTHYVHFLERVVSTPTDIPIGLEELRSVSEPPMIVRMTTTSRPQRRYDHRLRDLVQRTGDLTIATDLGVPRSTARGWLDAAPRVVVGLEVTDLTAPELRQEILTLRRRVEKLAALLRLALTLLHASGFSLSRERLPEEDAKRRILRAVDRAREWIPLRAALRFLGLSPSRFQAWRRRQTACALADQSSCPRTSPHRLRPCEVQAIGAMVTSPEYRPVPTGRLAVLAQRLGRVSASPSTWYRLVRKYGWRRPRVRVHRATPKVGLRTTGPDEMWHIDTTVIRLLDGTRAYLHAVIDNFSRRILAWRGRHVRTRHQRGRAARGQSGRDPYGECPSRLGGRGRGERQRPSRRIDRHGRAPAARLHGTEVLELDDRSLVAFPSNISGSFSIRSTALRPATGWWRSTSTNTTTCFHIRRFEDRRPTRCTSVSGTRCRRT